MKVRMDFTDGATNFFDEFRKVSFGLVKEGLSRASSQLANEYVKEIKSETPSEWGAINQKGIRRLSLTQKKKQFGQKYSKKTGDPIVSAKKDMMNIANNVKFYVPKELDKLYAVVAGGHPSFRPVDYENGIPKGYLTKVSGTTQKTLEMLDRLNDGATILLTKKQSAFLGRTKGITQTRPKKITIKARHFAERARSKGSARALQKVKNLYDANFNKAVANIKIKEKKISA